MACVLAAMMASAPAATPIDGKTFSEINLPAPIQEVPLSLAAARSWTWREGSTERVFLDRDVRVALGPYSFRARQASLWLEPVRIEGRDAEQVALYFAEVSDPAGAVGLSQQADRLLVTTVIARTVLNVLKRWIVLTDQTVPGTEGIDRQPAFPLLPFQQVHRQSSRSRHNRYEAERDSRAASALSFHPYVDPARMR